MCAPCLQFWLCRLGPCSLDLRLVVATFAFSVCQIMEAKRKKSDGESDCVCIVLSFAWARLLSADGVQPPSLAEINMELKRRKMDGALHCDQSGLSHECVCSHCAGDDEPPPLVEIEDSDKEFVDCIEEPERGNAEVEQVKTLLS